MRIGSRSISNDRADPVYIIAEIGVNHDGDPDRALLLIDLAAEAGADAVKFQYFESDRLMSSAAKLALYQKSAGETDPLAMLRRLQLAPDALARCAHHARECNLHAIVSVFSTELVPEAHRMGWDAFKSASPDIIHRPLLEAMASTGLPLIVSTGASEPEEVARARHWLDPHADRLAFLQCVSAYPCPMEHAALDGIAAVRALTGLPVGYSDHTPSIETGALAARAGARILEKHFTDDRSRHGPDHAASLEPADMAQYIRLARSATPDPLPPAPNKSVLPIERDVRAVSRQSIVWTRPLDAGATVSASDLACKRPGSGIPPWRMHEIIGARLSRSVRADHPVMPDEIEAPAPALEQGARP